MKATLRIILLLIASIFFVYCMPDKHADAPDMASRVSDLIRDSSNDMSEQNFDAAMEKALLALSLSEGNPALQVQALTTIVGIDIMTSRDDAAWTKALDAEVIARRCGFKKELSEILIAKAKLCSYAEISPETGRNDEGLVYANEALRLAQEAEAIEQQCEACYVLASLYINKNRWSNPIDQGIYRTAGQWLDEGQTLANTHDLSRLRRNGVIFRSRWFQQGDRNHEAITYFEEVLSSLKDSDHLTASALDDRLVRLYTRTGNYEKALDTHDDYVMHIQKYNQQKQAETLQKMETRFETQKKEREIERKHYQLWLLALLLLLTLVLIAFSISYIHAIRRRHANLQHVNAAKEELIQFLARDLRNPVSTVANEIAAISSSISTMKADEIRAKCESLANSTMSINDSVASYVEDILIKRSEQIADIGLSQREIQIIRLRADGLTAAQIAERTFLSVHTVNTHHQRIYAKIGVRNVPEMLRKVRDIGVI